MWVHLLFWQFCKSHPMESVLEVFCLHHATTENSKSWSRHESTTKSIAVILFNIIQCYAEHLLKRDTRLLCVRNFPCDVQKVRVVQMHLLHLVKQHELRSSFLIQLKEVIWYRLYRVYVNVTGQNIFGLKFFICMFHLKVN